MFLHLRYKIFSLIIVCPEETRHPSTVTPFFFFVISDILLFHADGPESAALMVLGYLLFPIGAP